jgi:hypothetical protein
MAAEVETPNDDVLLIMDSYSFCHYVWNAEAGEFVLIETLSGPLTETTRSLERISQSGYTLSRRRADQGSAWGTFRRGR